MAGRTAKKAGRIAGMLSAGVDDYRIADACHCSLDFVRQVRFQRWIGDHMKPEEENENILVVPTNVVKACNGGQLFEGFWKGVTPFEDVLDPKFHTLKRRGDMEHDARWKQLIPYVLVRRAKTPVGKPWFLSYTRSSDQAEKRLRNKSSIGIGGHVTKEDEELTPDCAAYRSRNLQNAVQDLLDMDVAEGESLLWAGMIRELFEELNIHGSILNASVVGLLNEEATDVGKVHLGVVILLDVATTSVDANDPYVQNLSWMSLDSLRVQKAHYEGWSKYCIDAIVAGAIEHAAG